MRYRELVTVQSPTEVRSAKGAVSHNWSDVLADVPATIVPSVVESRGADMTVIEDRFDVVLAGRLTSLHPTMSIVDGLGRRFDIEQIDYLLGGRQTRATCRLVDSPVAVEAGS